MTSKPLILTALIFLLLFSALSLADQIAELIVWIEGTIGVGTYYETELKMTVGEKNGTWIVINNTGNLRDILRLEGFIEDPTCSPCEYKDWIKFSFKCAETVGICDEEPSSNTKYVDDMQLTPQINQTEVYLEVVSYKITDPLNPPNISVTAYSLTNFTKQSNFAKIKLLVTGPSGTFESAELPEISPLWIPLLLVFATFIFYKKVV